MLDDGVSKTPLPSGGAGAPALVVTAAGRLDGFAMKDHVLWTSTLHEGDASRNPVWPARAQQLPGNRSETANVPVSAVSALPSTIDVFGIGIGRFAGRILRWSLRSGRWLQTALPSAHTRVREVRPTAVSRSPGVIDVFAVGDDGSILRWTADGETWTVREPLRIPDGMARRGLPPAVAVARPNRLDVVVIGDAPRGRTLWHWWCDDGSSFSGPEPVGPAVELAEVAVDAAWAGGDGRNLEIGMLLTVACITEGGLLAPRTLVRWEQGPGRWRWNRTRRDTVTGFTADGRSDRVWLEATPPVTIPTGVPAPVIAVSALRNAGEQDGLTRSLITWNGSEALHRVGRRGPSERGVGAVLRSGARVDAIVDVRDAVLHVWSGHHADLPFDLDPAHDVTLGPLLDRNVPPSAVEEGRRRLDWSQRMPWWGPTAIEFHVAVFDEAGELFREFARLAGRSVEIPAFHPTSRLTGRTIAQQVYDPHTGRWAVEHVAETERVLLPTRRVEITTIASRGAGPIFDWLGEPIRATAASSFRV